MAGQQMPTDALKTAEGGRAGEYFTADRTMRWLAAFFWIGLAARAVRYLLCFPLWEDECFLCINFVDRSFAELLQPLNYHQVAPPLFLWIELAVVKLFGYSEWSLRFVPFVASLASLYLFRRLASQFVDRTALVFAFGIFAVAYPNIRYAAEAKQYSSDLFASLLLLVFVTEWWRTKQLKWLWTAVAAVPLLLWLSYPAAFVAGGVSLTIALQLVLQWNSSRPAPAGGIRPLLRQLLRLESLKSLLRSQPAVWTVWGCFNAAVLIGFGSVYLVIKRQSAVDLGFMSNYWEASFPPLMEPWKLPLWFIVSHTSDLVAWPVGGGNGASFVTGLLVVLGVVAVLKSRRWTFCALLILPAMVNLVAAALQRYPYGGHVKFSMYLGPAVCILAGWGAAAWNSSIRERFPRYGWQAARATGFLLVLIAVASMARDISQPYKTLSDERARAFAQWFWFNAELQGQAQVVDRYRGKPFSPEATCELTWNVMFLCNQAIYGQPFDVKIPPPYVDSGVQPQRFLVYRDLNFTFDNTTYAEWQAEMAKKYELRSKETYPFSRFAKGERRLNSVDYLDIFTCVPKSPVSRVATLPAEGTVNH